MRLDVYTKVVLTVIALALLLIACKPLAQPVGVAAEGPFAGVQFSPDTGNVGFWLFDAKTGDVWHYGGSQSGAPAFCQRYEAGQH